MPVFPIKFKFTFLKCIDLLMLPQEVLTFRDKWVVCLMSADVLLCL